MQNITSNEDIRHRWNGHYRNRKMTKIFKREAGCCGRMKYFLCSDMNEHHGQSRLELYADYVEWHNQIRELENQQHDGQDIEEKTLMVEEKIQEMKSRQNTIVDKLKNIEILEDDYGIKIPDNELNQMNMVLL